MALQRMSRLTASSSSLLSTTPLTFTQPSIISPFLVQQRSATKRGGGSTRNNRDTAGRRLGVKRYDGQQVNAGSILVRQRGYEFHPGQHVSAGRDQTLYANQSGFVKFYKAAKAGKGQDASPRFWRRYCGIVLDKEEKLPRDETVLGRSRAFTGVDLIQFQKRVEEVRKEVQQDTLAA